MSRVDIAEFSGGIDTDNHHVDDSVRLYIETLDQSGRFIPALGSLQVTLVYIQPGKDAVTVATETFDARRFSDAYRTGIAGTHYTLVVRVTTPAPPGATQLTARIKLTDAPSGVCLESEKVVSYSGPK